MRTRHAQARTWAIQMAAWLAMSAQAGSFVSGQQTHVPQPAGAPLRTILEVSPARTPDPVLKHRLIPGYGERRPGNAAVYYGKVTAEQWQYSRQEFWDEWSALGELGRAEKLASPKLDDFARTPGYSMLRAGALCDDCDWQLPLREENAIAVLLPEVQQTRMFARLLALQAIHQIRERDLEGSIESIQTGLALGVNVARAPCLVNQLVAVAIHGLMREPLELLVEQPETPSLYWAMAHFPRPLVDLRDALEAEADVMLRHLPGMDQIGSESSDVDFWARQYDRFLEASRDFGRLSRPADQQSLANLPLAVIRYSQAKQVLSRAGWSQESVDGFPVGKALLLAEQVRYQQRAQAAAALAALPWRQITPELLRIETTGQTMLLADQILPAISHIRVAQLRSERFWTALQTVEALRHYAATHDGKLPDSLDQLTETPAPDDPATGKPFEYQRDGNVAIIEGPDIESPLVPFGYEVRLRPAG